MFVCLSACLLVCLSTHPPVHPRPVRAAARCSCSCSRFWLARFDPLARCRCRCRCWCPTLIDCCLLEMRASLFSSPCSAHAMVLGSIYSAGGSTSSHHYSARARRYAHIVLATCALVVYLCCWSHCLDIHSPYARLMMVLRVWAPRHPTLLESRLTSQVFKCSSSY